MLIVERQQRILELVRGRKTVQLDELARELDVSSSTVRRDLEALEERGIVDRTRAGAIYRDPVSGDRSASVALATRMAEHIAEKRAIGAAAAALVQPQMTVLLDGGSTVVQAAHFIEARPIQIVTNSISIAHHFKDDDQVEILLAGGSLYPRTEVTVGPITTGTLAELHADLLLFSLAGIYDDAAFNMNLQMARVEQVMMQQATESVMLMDSSKFGRKSLARVCGLDEVDRIITDSGVDDQWRERLEKTLVVAPTPGV